jgi:hypothetical protein
MQYLCQRTVKTSQGGTNEDQPTLRDALRRVRQVTHWDAMNELNVSLQHSILTLAAHGWSHRRIELDINRETVGKYLRLVNLKPAISNPGSTAGR